MGKRLCTGTKKKNGVFLGHGSVVLFYRGRMNHRLS